MYYANWRENGSKKRRRWPKWVAGAMAAAVLLGAGWMAVQPAQLTAPTLNQESRPETAVVQLLGAAQTKPGQSGFVAQTTRAKHWWRTPWNLRG